MFLACKLLFEKVLMDGTIRFSQVQYQQFSELLLVLQQDKQYLPTLAEGLQSKKAQNFPHPLFSKNFQSLLLGL